VTTNDHFARRTVRLTSEEVAEIQRRKSNAAATRQIVKLKDDLRGLKYSIDFLKAIHKANASPIIPGVAVAFAVKLLLAEQRRIRSEIKGLEEGKQPKVGKP